MCPPLTPQTFLNPWYEASLVPIYIITVCTGLWAFVTAGGSFHNVLKCLSCKGRAGKGIFGGILGALCVSRDGVGGLG